MGDDKSLLWSLVILLHVKSSLGTAGRSVSLACCSRGNEISSSPAKPARRNPCCASFPGDLWLCPQGRLEPVLETQGAPSKPSWLFLCPTSPGGTEWEAEWVNISPVALGLGLQPFLHPLHFIFISQTEKGDGEQRFSIAGAAGRAVTSPP